MENVVWKYYDLIKQSVFDNSSTLRCGEFGSRCMHCSATTMAVMGIPATCDSYLFAKLRDEGRKRINLAQGLLFVTNI